MKKKSLAVNSVWYTIKTLVSVIFPLITFPYISRILQADGLGKYNFSNAYVSYFALIAGLGITTYAIREGAKIRENRAEILKFTREVFTINIISCMVSWVLLVISVYLISPLFQYRPVVLVLSLTIPLTTIGTEWIFNIYEDFVYITIRSIFFQFLSVVLMFVMVRTVEDVINYAFVSVIAAAGSNILNYKKACTYFDHKICVVKNTKRHIKPIFILFASSIASQIYINADIIMLGLMKGDYATGIYSAASKIYNIVRMVLAALISVMVPRLAYLKENEGEEEYKGNTKQLFVGYSALVLPVSMGVFCISEPAVGILLGEEFLESIVALQILAIALIFTSMGTFIASTILIVYNQERRILLATTVGACINIVGNLYCISVFSYTGAAITTLLSEMIVFGIQYYYVKKCVNIVILDKEILKIVIGTLGIALWCNGVMKCNLGNIISLSICIIGSVVLYFGIEVILKQKFVCGVFEELIFKIRKGN